MATSSSGSSGGQDPPSGTRNRSPGGGPLPFSDLLDLPAFTEPPPPGPPTDVVPGGLPTEASQLGPVFEGLEVAGARARPDEWELSCEVSSFGPSRLSLVLSRDGQSRVLGRHPECPLQVLDSRVSRRHLSFMRPEAGRLQAMDLGSCNGSHLADREMREGRWYDVEDGDSLVVGSTLIRVRRVYGRSRQELSDEISRLLFGGDEGEGAVQATDPPASAD